MNTVSCEKKVAPTESAPRARQVWLLSVQVIVLALMVLGLVWSATPAKPYQAMLALVAMASLIFALLPGLRRSEAAAVTGGIALALACMLSYDHTWTASFLASSYIPLITPIVVAAAVVLAIWGLCVRVGLGGQARLGRGAVVGALLISVLAVLFYLLINTVPAFKLAELNYAMFPDQLQEIIATALLYPLALWLGGTGVRAASRWPLLQIGTPIIFFVFLLLWHVR